MRTITGSGLAIVLGILVGSAQSGEPSSWGIAKGETRAAPGPEALGVRLGRPQPLSDGRAERIMPSDPPPVSPGPLSLVRHSVIVRAQSPDVPPPPVPPPPAPPPGAASITTVPAVPPGEEAFNCGVVTKTTSKVGGFFGQWWDNTRQFVSDVPGTVTGVFQPGPGGKGLFQSDHKFDGFISPVTIPFYFEDPRALTEIRPIFMWQVTPRENPIFAGGDNLFLGSQFRVALTDWASLVIHRFGGNWMEPHVAAPGFEPHVGFSELWLGPKFTFIRNDTSGTLMAAGLIFEVPTGPAKVFQDTGNLSLAPYFSFGQNFLRSFSYGSFNFLNTTGYNVRTDNTRSEYFYTNFHLDFDVGNLHRIYPLIEMSWFHYTRNGAPLALGFEGADLYNFGSNNAGRDELFLGLGFRYKFTEHIQTGLAAQWGLLDGLHHLEGFRLTVDFIFRY